MLLSLPEGVLRLITGAADPYDIASPRAARLSQDIALVLRSVCHELCEALRTHPCWGVLMCHGHSASAILRKLLVHRAIVGLEGLPDSPRAAPFLACFPARLAGSATLSTRVADAIATCPHLTSVDLGATGVSDFVVAAIAAHCPQLRHAALHNCPQLTDAAARSLRRCPALRDVDLGFCGLTDAAAEAFADAPSLTAISFARCAISRLGCRSLARCPALLYADFSFCQDLDAMAAAELAKAPRLESVSFRSCRLMSDAAAVAVAPRSLTMVDFSGCHALSDTAACALPSFSLRDVNLSRCGNLTDKAVRALARAPLLETLSVSGCENLTDAALVALAQCRHLRSLDVSGCFLLNDAAVQAVAKGCPLEVVSVSRCGRLTDDAVRALATCPLREVDVAGCGRLTNAAVDALRSCENLLAVNLHYCDWLCISAQAFASHVKVMM